MQSISFDTERLLRTFLEMVRIDSPSGEEDAMREYLIERVKPWGVPFHTDAGGNLIVEIPAHQCAHDSILLVSGHMDVVPPCHNIQPVVEQIEGDTLISSDNTTVLGADDKAGLAPVLEAVALSLRENLPRPALKLVFTTREETMLGGAKDLSDADLKASFAVTFDHTGRQGVIIHQAPSYIEFTITCKGKSVHAGIMPEQGVNAIIYAGKVIDRLHLGRIDEWTTANVGFWEGGKGTNVVPDDITIRGELRGHKPEVLERELAYIAQVLDEEKATMPGTDYAFEHVTEFHAYRIDPEHPGLRRVAEAAERTGLKPELIYTNGGSDNNVFAHRGLPGVVLSAGYMEPHSLKERVRLSEMEICARFTLAMFEAFAGAPF